MALSESDKRILWIVAVAVSFLLFGFGVGILWQIDKAGG